MFLFFLQVCFVDFVCVCLFVCLFWQSFRLKNYIVYLCSIYHFDSGLITKTRAVLNMIHVNIDMVRIVYMITTVEVTKFSIWSKFILRWTSWPNRWRKWWVFIHLRVVITLNSPCPNFSAKKNSRNAAISIAENTAILCRPRSAV